MGQENRTANMEGLAANCSFPHLRFGRKTVPLLYLFPLYEIPSYAAQREEHTMRTKD